MKELLNKDLTANFTTNQKTICNTVLFLLFQWSALLVIGILFETVNKAYILLIIPYLQRCSILFKRIMEDEKMKHAHADSYFSKSEIYKGITGKEYQPKHGKDDMNEECKTK